MSLLLADPTIITTLVVFFFLWMLVVSYVLYRHCRSPHDSPDSVDNSDEAHPGASDLSSLHKEISRLHQLSERYVQKLGIVRYNPYNDTGGNQSFVIALLDARGDGVVLSSLHNRTGTRVYSKPVRGGLETEFPLSDEEKKAIQNAMEDTE